MKKGTRSSSPSVPASTSTPRSLQLILAIPYVRFSFSFFFWLSSCKPVNRQGRLFEFDLNLNSKYFETSLIFLINRFLNVIHMLIVLLT